MTAPEAESARPTAANDGIQIALIGTRGQGQGDTKIAMQVPGVKLVGSPKSDVQGKNQTCAERGRAAGQIANLRVHI